eukprot:8999747-Prorocentrum_lima.AAC.1
MADAAIPPVPLEIPRALVKGEELPKEQIEAMNVQEKKELFEKISQSQKDAQIKWERDWKGKHPNTMPRAFTEADTGAAG